MPKAGLTPEMVDITGAESFHRTLGIFAYKNRLVSRLVWSIKYKKSEPAVKIAGFALKKVLSALLYTEGISGVIPTTVIIPMPITRRRRRERGYNQCELITTEISKYVNEGIPILFKNDLLLRTHHTSHQKYKDREDRLELGKGIFKVDDAALTALLEKIGEKDTGNIRFIVIDDVITTGTTIKEAIETMKMSGLKNVRGLALAH